MSPTAAALHLLNFMAPALGVALLKEALTNAATTMEGALRAEIDYQPILRRSKDHQAACKAFVEKTSPVFTGE